MNTIKLMLSSVTLVFLTACGGGGGGGGSTTSTPSSVAPPSSAPAGVSNAVTSSVAPVQQALKSVELSVPEGFDFSTEREVVVCVDVASYEYLH